MRVARWAVSSVFVLNGVGIGLWSAHVPYVQQHTGVNARVLGFALLTVAAGAIVAMPVAGWLSTRIGSRRTVGMGAVALCLSMPLLVASISMWELFITAFLFGAANGLMDVSMNANAAHVESAHGRPIMSTFHGWFSVGGMLGAVLGGILLKIGWGGWTGVGLICAAGLVLCAVAVPRLFAAREPAHAAKHVVWPRGTLLLLGVMALLVMAVEGALIDWSALLVRERTGVTVAAAATAYSAFSIAMAACRFLGDRVTLRFGQQRVIAVGGVGIFLGLLGAVLSTNFAGSVAGLALVGAGASNIVPLIFSAAARSRGMSAGNGVATAASFGYAGCLLGPPVIGWVASLSSVAAALGLLSLVGVATAVCARAVDAEQPERVNVGSGTSGGSG